MTDVEDEAARNAITSAVEQSSTTARLLAVFAAADAVGRHNMVGLFNDATTGTMLAIANIDLEKSASEVMNIYWIISMSSA
jgi:hypothetical protein